MKLNLSLPILNLAGEPIKEGDKELDLGIKFSEFLIVEPTWDAEKVLRFARSFFNKQEIECEVADAEALVLLLKQDQQFLRALVKGQIIEAIKAQIAAQAPKEEKKMEAVK